MTTTEATRWRREAEAMRQRLFYEDRDEGGEVAVTGPFSPDEDQQLREMFQKFSNADMSLEMGRSIGDIARRLIELRLNRKRQWRPWTSEDIKTLREYYGKESYRELAKRLGRGYGSVYRKVKDTFG